MGKILIGKQVLKIKNCKHDRIKRIHTCEVCNEKFYSARNTAMYCSNACKQLAYRNRVLMYSL